MTRKTCMWLLTISNLVSCHPPHFQTFWTCYFLCLKWVFFFSGFHKLTPHPSGVSLNIIFSETHPWLHDEKKSLCYSSSLSSVHFLHNPSCTHVVLCSPEYYRHASFYCTSQMLCFFFLQIEGLWQLFVEQVYQRHFSNGICSLRVSVSYIGDSPNISNLSIFVTVICDQWSLILLLQKDDNSLKAQMMVRIFCQ